MSYDGTLKFDTAIDTSGFSSGASKLGSLASGALKATTAIVTAATTAVAGLGTAAVKMGSEFESQMSRVQAISGASASELEKLNSQALQLGADTAFSAQEAAEGMEMLASAGFSAVIEEGKETSEIMEAMPGMLDLAASSGEDLATSAEIAASTLRGFGLAASDAGHVADVLAENAARTNAGVADTGEAMKYVSSVAHAMGISMEETAAAIGIMSDAGIKGSQAGTTLRSALSRISKPTKQMKTVMDELGISFYDAEGNMKSLTEITKMLQNSTAGLTQEEKQNAITTLFGQEAMSGILALMDRGSDELGSLTESYKKCDDAAANMATTMQQNLASQVEQLGGSFESLGISVYQSVKEPLTETVKTLNDLSDSLLTAFNENGFEGLVTQFGNCLAQVAQMALEAAPTLVDTAKNLIHSFFESLVNNGDEFGTAGAGLVTSLANAIVESTGDMIVTGGALLTSLLEGFANSDIGSLVTTVTSFVDSVANSIVTNAPTCVTAAASIIASLAQGIIDGLPTIIETAVSVVEQFISGISTSLPQLTEIAVELITTLTQGLTTALPQLLEGVTQIFTGIVEALPTMIELLLAALPTIITSIVEFITASLPQFIEAIMTMVNSLIESFPTIIEAIVAALPTIIESIVTALTEAAPLILEAGITLLLSLIEAIPSVIEALLESLPQIIETIVSTIVNASPELFSAAVELLWQLVLAIPQVLIDLLATLGSAFAEIYDWVLEHIPELIDSIVEWLKEFPGRAYEAIIGLIDKLGEWAGKVGEWIIERVPEIIESFIEYFKELPGKIWEALTDVYTTLTEFGSEVWEKMKSIGWDIVGGVWQGIKDKASEFYNNVKGFFGGLVGGSETYLDIGSPSRVFADRIGQWIPAGIEVGIDESMPSLLKSTQDQMDALTSQMQAEVMAETGNITIGGVASNIIDNAALERQANKSVNVTGEIQNDRPIEVTAVLQVDSRKFAQTITPAVNQELYKIDALQNNRGRG